MMQISLRSTSVVLPLAIKVLRPSKHSMGEIALPQCNVSFAQLGLFRLQL